jgi:acetolactate synthase-1/3 small subunit
VQSANSKAIIAAAQQAGASVAQETADAITFEIVGNAEKIGSVVEILRPYGIQELARSGCVALTPIH